MKPATFLRGIALTASWLSLGAAIAACAALPAATMALPDTLAALPAEPLRGLRGGRTGEFTIGALHGRYERGASRLALFDDAFVRDRNSVQVRSDDGVELECHGRQGTLALRALAVAAQPYTLRCAFRGSLVGELTLSGEAVSQRATRSGQATLGGTTFELRSVHHVRGSPLPLDAPIGYLLMHGGQAVAAVELNGDGRLWRLPSGPGGEAAVAHIALALALAWDPSAL